MPSSEHKNRSQENDPGSGNIEDSAPAADRYRTGKTLIESPAGRLYEAVHKETSRHVWLWICAPPGVAQGDARTSLSGKVQALVSSRCDHLVQIIDMELPEEADDRAGTLIYEEVQGETLASRLETRRFSVAKACSVIRAVLRAMKAAHEAGQVPMAPGSDDVFLTRYGGRLDFVRVFCRVTPDPPRLEQSQSDVKAAARLLYLCLTGRVPSEDAGPDGIMEEIRKQAIPEGAADGAVRSVAEICARGLAGGYPFPSDLASDIEATGLVDPDGEAEAVSVSIEKTLPPDFVRGAEPEDSLASTVEGKLRPDWSESPKKTASAAEPAATTEAVRAVRLKRVSVFWATFGLALGIGFTLLFQVARRTPGKSENARRPSPAARDRKPRRPDAAPLRFGLAYYTKNPVVLNEARNLARYLAKRTGARVLVKDLPYERVADGLERGELDLALFTPFLYVEARKKYKRFHLLATQLADGALTYEGYIVVSEQRSVRALLSLKKARFCFVTGNSTSGYLFPLALLNKNGIHPTAASNRVRFSGSHKAAIRDLLDGKCDAAAVSAGAYLKAVLSHQGGLRIVAVTERIPGLAYCASHLLPDRLVERLRQALLTFDPPRDLGRRFLGPAHRVTGFVSVGDSHYDPVRRLRLPASSARRRRAETGP